jgi:acetyl esterase/lipase
LLQLVTIQAAFLPQIVVRLHAMNQARPEILKRIAAAAIGALLGGCSPLELLNQTSPDRHYERTAGIAYGAEPRQVLDVYRPAAPLPSAPVVVFFYGGGWRSGDRGNYEFVASALTEAGITVVIPDYRLYPDVTFPAFVEDAAAAVSWSARNADRLGVSTDAIFLMGHSAGAHIASLVALDPSYLARDSETDVSIRAWVGLSGPYDFLPIEWSYLQDVFPEPNREQSQPVNFVTPDAPPALLIHGAGDRTVRIENSHSLLKRLRDEGVAARLKTYEDVGHVGVVLALAPPLDFVADTLKDSRDFIIDTLFRKSTIPQVP